MNNIIILHNSIAFCKSNCAVIGSSGCTTCKDGFMREPDCCECVLPGQDEVTGVCSKLASIPNVIKTFNCDDVSIVTLCILWL